MLPLEDPRWKDFNGGYGIPYNASVPLLKLERSSSTEEIDEIFSELLQELHHQGDVGLASYFAVPHIIRIAKAKSLFHFNVFGLISVIEIERHSNNPGIPEEYEDEYQAALQYGIPELVRMCLEKNWDLTLSSTILSALAASKGHIQLAQAISKMEDVDITKEFLENF
jgi:hypothetical protein